jgi:hypothetical protein
MELNGKIREIILDIDVIKWYNKRKSEVNKIWQKILQLNIINSFVNLLTIVKSVRNVFLITSG